MIFIILRPAIFFYYKGFPASSVYPQVLANVGKTENMGFEAALNLRIIENKDFSWTSDITYSINRDKIVSLASGETQDVSNPNQALIVGEPVRAFYGYEANGCWRIDEAATGSDIQSCAWRYKNS